MSVYMNEYNRLITFKHLLYKIEQHNNKFPYSSGCQIRMSQRNIFYEIESTIKYTNLKSQSKLNKKVWNKIKCIYG